MHPANHHFIRTVRSWVVMLCVVSGEINEDMEMLMKGERQGKGKKYFFKLNKLNVSNLLSAYSALFYLCKK
jgi:hypothetical protein